LLAYLFNLEDITRNDLGSFNLEETAITENNSFESECLFQFVDNGTGLEFLDETNSGVKKEQSANDTKIYPILKTCGENGSSLRELTLEFFVSFNFLTQQNAACCCLKSKAEVMRPEDGNHNIPP